MRKQWKRKISIGLALMMLLTVFPSLPAGEEKHQAEGAVTESPYINVPAFHLSKDRTQMLGTEENPFVVLELVPYEGYAEFGYLVKGQEPIDFESQKLKYVGSMTEANNVLAAVNSIIGNQAFSVIEEKKYVDYYTNHVNLAGEDYPDGYVDRYVEDCYGYFEKAAAGTGKYKLTGKIGNMSLQVEYCGTGGNYNFVPEYRESAVPKAYKDMFEKSSDTPVAGDDTVTISYYLTSKSYGNAVYACYKGKYGRFERDYNGNGSHKISGSADEKNFSVQYCGTGGNWKFVEKEGDASVPQDLFYGTRSVTTTAANGAARENTLVAYMGSQAWANIYVKYLGKYGYLTRNYGNNGNVKVEGEFDSGFTKISEAVWNGNYNFTEDASAEQYFRTTQDVPVSILLSTANAPIRFHKNGVAQQDQIRISYANSNTARIFAKIRYCTPPEYHFDNKNYFLINSVGVPAEECADYRIRVITVTPETLQANQGLIDAADFVNITDSPHVANIPETWAKYYRKSMFSPSEADIWKILNGTLPKYTYLEHDISWEVAVKLLKRISMPNEYATVAPLSIAVTCYQGLMNAGSPYTSNLTGFRLYSDGCKTSFGGTGIINNVAKLYFMLMCFQTDEDGYFYHHFIETNLVRERTVELTPGRWVTTGSFDCFFERYGNARPEVTAGALYWNEYTFLQIENHDISRVVNHSHETSDDPALLYKESDMITLNGSETNFSVRNNVFTYNSDCSLTQHVVSNVFSYADTDFRREPFQMLEFCEQDKISPVDVLYYLLHQERSALRMLINDSASERIFSNVDYDAMDVDTALVGEIVTKPDASGQPQLYGRVRIKASLSANRQLQHALVDVTIYQEQDVYDNKSTSDREDIITISQAYNVESGALEPIRLGMTYYYDVPLKILEKSNTEDLKFSLKVHYRYKGSGSDATEEAYEMEKELYGYHLNPDGSVKSDDRRTLTFVRRALFLLD